MTLAGFGYEPDDDGNSPIWLQVLCLLAGIAGFAFVAWMLFWI